MLSSRHRLVIFLFLLACSPLRAWQREAPVPSLPAPATPAQTGQSGQLEVKVVDQDGARLFSATVTVTSLGDGATAATGEIGGPGTAVFHLAPGVYKVVIKQKDFYAATAEKVTVVAGQTTPVEVQMHPVKEYSEEVDVASAASPIDPQQSASTEQLTAEEIATIPYPTTRDYRNILRFFPGVIRDINGGIHVAGGNTQQTQDYLDGFEVSQPAGGLSVRLNPDALRKISLETSRYSSLYGKGSAGLASFDVQDGHDRFRLSATDFVPTLQNVKGITYNNWTPRATFSGPLVRGRAWFLISHEGEIDKNIVKELPDGADTNRLWRFSELARVKVSVTPKNSLSFDGLLNLTNSDNAGIDQFNPISVSVNQDSAIFVLGAKDQIAFAKDSLLEFGVGGLYSRATEQPMGTAPYFITPAGELGNFYRTNANYSYRFQAFSNLFLHPVQWHGSHQFAFGGGWDTLTYHQLFVRQDIFTTDNNNTVVRQVHFDNAPPFTLHTQEPDFYFQDRWSFHRVLLEAGARWDADSLTEKQFISPRLAGALLVSKESETKISAGGGYYYDRNNLGLLGRTLQGTRTDSFFDAASNPAHAPVVTRFVADVTHLDMPRFVNWSAAIERRMPARIYTKVEYQSRHGIHGWGFENQPSGLSILRNDRQDRYDAVTVTLRRELKRGYPVLASYTHSSARTNQFLDFGPDNPTFGSQVAGPQPWDAPNQVVSWGSTPLFWKLRKFDVAYSFLWRTGFPYPTVNDFQELVEGPAGHRFPSYMTLNPALERKFSFKGYRWAARAGFENITSHPNPLFVDNILGSPFFGLLFGQSHRTFNGRIRLLGKE